MKRLFALILLPATMLATGANAQTTNEEAALASFKALVQRHVDSYQLPNGRVHVQRWRTPDRREHWVKKRFFTVPASAKFDVTKTSSLVTPFVGTFSFTVIENRTVVHETEADAAADNIFPATQTVSIPARKHVPAHDSVISLHTITVHKHMFVYQDQKWQPATRTHQYQFEGVGLGSSEYDCDKAFVSPDGYKDEITDQDRYGCLEEFDGVSK